MAARPILVAATRQHVGKTTLSLALMSGLRKRFGDRVGFIKPVGQEHVRPAGEAFSVDKDVELMRMYFGLDHVGFGNDFNHGGGIRGFEDASGALVLTEGLLARGYSEAEIAKGWGGNFLRVMRAAAEAAAD